VYVVRFVDPVGNVPSAMIGWVLPSCYCDTYLLLPICPCNSASKYPSLILLSERLSASLPYAIFTLLQSGIVAMRFFFTIVTVAQLTLLMSANGSIVATYVDDIRIPIDTIFYGSNKLFDISVLVAHISNN
jgi:hypothetical protein